LAKSSTLFLNLAWVSKICSFYLACQQASLWDCTQNEAALRKISGDPVSVPLGGEEVCHH
jgi:hypothetical protein